MTISFPMALTRQRVTMIFLHSATFVFLLFATTEFPLFARQIENLSVNDLIEQLESGAPEERARAACRLAAYGHPLTACIQSPEIV